MFNSVQYVRDICLQRKIPISQLEKDCGFSNGYLNPKKMTRIPYDRAQIISDYLNISVTSIMTGDTQMEKAPADNSKRSVRDEDIKFALFRGREGITDEMYKEVLSFAEYVARREEEKRNKE